MVQFAKKKLYTEKDLVSFGNYLLSKERVQYFDKTVIKRGDHKKVWDNDLANWNDKKYLKLGKK